MIGPTRTVMLVALVAAAVVLASVGVLALASSGGSAGATGAPVTFSQARASSTAVLPPGHWGLEAAIGLDMWNETTVKANLSIPLNCSFVTPPGHPFTGYTFPAYRGDISTGAAVTWVLAYLDPSANASAVVLVTNGSAAWLGTESGRYCIQAPPNFNGGIPYGVVDSSTAALALDQDGASQYLAGNRSGDSLLMSLFPAFGPFTTTWSLVYTPCGGAFAGQTTGPTNGTEFGGNVNATTGAVVNARAETVDCQQNLTTAPPSLLSVFNLGYGGSAVLVAGAGGTVASQGCTSGDYCYAIPVTIASNGIDPADLSFSVERNGTLSAVPQGYAFVDGTGAVVVYSLGSIASSWQAGVGSPTTQLTTSDLLWIDMGPQDPTGHGYVLEVYGVGVYSGYSMFAYPLP